MFYEMLLSTDAIVLHCFEYSETSLIVRLATRDAGVQSAIAKGARRAKSRFGTALDLFAQGAAELHLKEGRELQTLGAFDVTRSRAAIGLDLGRFAGASVIAELVLSFGAANETNEDMFDALAETLDRITAADPESTGEAGLAGAWRLVAQLGFAPSLDACSMCHRTEIGANGALPFSHVAGGIVCPECVRQSPTDRMLPAHARRAIAAWCDGGRVSHVAPGALRSHQRLLREFLHQHLADGRTLRALDAWEHGAWSSA